MKTLLRRRNSCCLFQGTCLFPFLATMHFSSIAEPAHSANNIEEVFVTARKRTESSQDVPIALSIFNEQTINSPLIENISSLAALSPNVNFIHTAPLSGSSNAASVFIRGVGQNDFLLTTDPAVGVYLDGVYIARSIGGVLQLVDTERVEILRGPQGTLFGKNTIGGAVQVISREPAEEFTANITATVGDENRSDVKASIEGSLAENVQARLSVLSEARDGYSTRILDNTELGDIDRQSYLARLSWQINDNNELALSIDHTHQRQEALPQSIIGIVDTPIRDLYNTLVAAPLGTAWDERWITGNPFSTFQTGPSEDDADITGASLSFIHNGSNVEFTSITGYREMSAHYGRDPDGSPLQYAHSINHDDHKQFSQELRLAGTSLDEKIDWLAGLYYFREHGKNLTEGFLFSGIYQATCNLGACNPILDFDFNVNNDVITESSAFFAQMTTHINDQLNLTVGLRQTYEEKEFSVDNFTLNSGLQFIGPETVEDDWDNTSPMISVDYHLNENTMTYLSASRGFKSGGYNGRQIFPGEVNQYDPEFVTSYEAGIKTHFEQQNINLEAAIFSVDYKDMQFTTLVGGAGGLLPIIDNAAKAEIDGVEISVSGSPISSFSFNTGIGYLDARYTNVDDNSVITGDEELIRTPEWNAHMQLAYRWQLDTSGTIELTGHANFTSKVYHDSVNTEAIAEDDLTLVNASIGWLSADNRYQVEAFVTNLTDKTYLISGASELAAFGGNEAHYARPREWGLRVSYTFE